MSQHFLTNQNAGFDGAEGYPGGNELERGCVNECYKSININVHIWIFFAFYFEYRMHKSVTVPKTVV